MPSAFHLTEEMIAAAMAKADARVCVGSDRRQAFPHRLEDAFQSCTPKGRCKVGWIVSKGGCGAGWTETTCPSRHSQAVTSGAQADAPRSVGVRAPRGASWSPSGRRK